MSRQPPSCGRMVHYTLSEVDSPKAVHRIRPAIVIDVVEGNGDACNLHVMTNGGRDDLSLVHWKGGVPYNENGDPGTWRWPPFVSPVKDAPKKEEKHFVATPPPGFSNVPEQASLGGLLEAEKKLEQFSPDKPVTDRYHTIADVAGVPTKPEVSPAPDGLPFAYDKETADDEEEHEPESSR